MGKITHTAEEGYKFYIEDMKDLYRKEKKKKRKKLKQEKQKRKRKKRKPKKDTLLVTKNASPPVTKQDLNDIYQQLDMFKVTNQILWSIMLSGINGNMKFSDSSSDSSIDILNRSKFGKSNGRGVENAYIENIGHGYDR